MLKQACVSLQQHAEQDEEYISNSLMKRIKNLEKEKAKLEAIGEDTQALHYQLEHLRKEKVDLENKLEQESEFVVNKMVKEKEKLLEKNHLLEEMLHQRSSSPMIDSSLPVVRELSQEVLRLRQLLISSGKADSDQVAHMLEEQQQQREEILRLNRKVHFLLEKIASLEKANLQIRAEVEMDDERHFNDFRRSSSSPAPRGSLPPGGSPSMPFPHQSPQLFSHHGSPHTQPHAHAAHLRVESNASLPPLPFHHISPRQHHSPSPQPLSHHSLSVPIQTSPMPPLPASTVLSPQGSVLSPQAPILSPQTHAGQSKSATD